MCPFFNKNIRLLLSSNYLVHGNTTYSFFFVWIFSMQSKMTKPTTNCAYFRWPQLFSECVIFMHRSIQIYKEKKYSQKKLNKKCCPFGASQK